MAFFGPHDDYYWEKPFSLQFSFIVTFGEERIWVSKLKENEKLFVKDWKHV